MVLLVASDGIALYDKVLVFSVVGGVLAVVNGGVGC